MSQREDSWLVELIRRLSSQWKMETRARLLNTRLRIRIKSQWSLIWGQYSKNIGLSLWNFSSSSCMMIARWGSTISWRKKAGLKRVWIVRLCWRVHCRPFYRLIYILIWRACKISTWSWSFSLLMCICFRRRAIQVSTFRNFRIFSRIILCIR